MTSRAVVFLAAASLLVCGPGVVDPKTAAQDYATVMRKLAAWKQAVDAHEPGVRDQAVLEIAGWPATRLAGAVDLVRELALYDDVDDLVRRGAMLHLDAVVFGVAKTVGPVPRDLSRPGLDSIDARGASASVASVHIMTARLLLDEITPRVQDDDIARLWYRATSAYLSAAFWLTDLKAHLEKAAAVFGPDAVTAFDRGCLYETFASRRVRAIIEMTPLRPGRRFDVPTERASLAEATRHFRRALELDPAMVDARLRLGRVLLLTAREDDGVAELERALAQTTRPDWRYDASLYLGRAAEARGDLAKARERFEAARVLYPRAQAPMLALARLSGMRGATDEQSSQVAAVLGLGLERSDEDDPWWTYHRGIGRDVDSLLAELRRRMKARQP